MHTVVAIGLIRETARLIHNGTELEAAIQSATKGSSKVVQEAYLAQIQAHCAKVRKITPNVLKAAILNAALSL
jgi:hypothetical protein